MTTSPRSAFALPLLALLAACSGGAAPTPTPRLGAACAAPPFRHGPIRPAANRIDPGLGPRIDRYVADTMPNMLSLMVVRGGEVQLERYYNGATATTPFELRSATKSFISALVGQALARRQLRTLDQRIHTFFPEYFRNQDPTSLKWRISIEQLLTMTSGLQWNERAGLPNVPPDIPESTWVALPMQYRPGTVYNYTSGGTHILSIILKRATGLPARELANRDLFGPIGYTVPKELWEADPHGNSWGGFGLQLTADQMARFGYLYLQDGCWETTRVLPAGWVGISTRAHQDTPFGKDTYGYLWWRTALDGHPAYFAGGYGGQYIIVIPDLDAVVVTTAIPGENNDATDPMTVVRRFVIPSLTAEGRSSPSRGTVVGALPARAGASH